MCIHAYMHTCSHHGSVYDQGFVGLWSPSEVPVAYLNISRISVILARTTQWDGVVGGRIRIVIENTPRRDRAHARNFLDALDALQAIIGEVLTPEPWAESTWEGGMEQCLPMVMMSRSRDNVYLSLCNIPDEVQTQTLHAIEVLLRVVYGIPLKWEKHTDTVVWGEAQVRVNPDADTVHVNHKGIVSTLRVPEPTEPNEWARWVRRESPNARTVWRSQLPSLLLKSIWSSLSSSDLLVNVRSLIWGLGFHGYPRRWWRPALFRLWRKYRLERIFDMAMVDRWVREGASLSMPVGAEGP